MTVIADFTFVGFTSDQSGQSSRKIPVDPLSGGKRLGAVCANCSSEFVVADDRCRSCYQFKYRNGYDRPDNLITKAANRYQRRGGSMRIDLDDEAMTKSVYSDPIIPASCVCGCRRTADNFKSTDGLSTFCRNLRHHQAQRVDS
jgi:hypothetical protein